MVRKARELGEAAARVIDGDVFAVAPFRTQRGESRIVLLSVAVPLGAAARVTPEGIASALVIALVLAALLAVSRHALAALLAARRPPVRHPPSSSLTPRARLSPLPAHQAVSHTLRSSSPQMSVPRATLIEPAIGSIGRGPAGVFMWR